MSNKIRRPDLEAAPVKFPDYIGTKIFPFLGKAQQGGTMYYQKYKQDVAAQYGRNTAALAEITHTVMAAATTTFACQEVRGRFMMSYDQVRGYADTDHADLAMGRVSKRSFYNKIEILAAKAALENASAIDATADIVATVENQATALQDLAKGPVCMAISDKIFTLLKKDAAITDRMKFSGIGVGQGGDARFVTPEQLAAIFGVRRVYVGADDLWRLGVGAAYRGNACLFVEGDENEDPAETCQLGRTIFFEWDNAVRHFVMESYEDDDKDARVVDSKGQVDLKVLNTELMKTVTLFAADESDSESESN